MSKKIKKKKSNKFLKIFSITFLSIVALFSLLIFTPVGKELLTSILTSHVYNKINYDENSIGNAEDTPSKDFNYGKDIVNVLLIGVEAIGYKGTGVGNTDTLMIATMNTTTKQFKLTSIMRDTWVTIPGHDDDRINSVYAKGGVPLLYQCIEQNFDLKLDGYALVGFESFEKIVDEIGGVEVTLSAQEARYLNTTNYISNKKYRNVKEGTQIFNGNQALGYCRVRKVPTPDGTHDDFGRIARQKAVLGSIFDKVKTQGITDLIKLTDSVLPLITTDIPPRDFKAMLNMAIKIGPANIENLRIPADKEYSFQKIRRKDVVLPSMPATKDTLHKFIFEPPVVENETEPTKDTK